MSPMARMSLLLRTLGLCLAVAVLAGAPNARAAWLTYAGNAQHTALSSARTQPLQRIHWQTPVDLAPQYSGIDLLIHYGSPLITAGSTTGTVMLVSRTA